MPYIIKAVDKGFKVCKANNPKKCFSKYPLTKKKAEAQLKAIGISEHLKGGNKPVNQELYNEIKQKIYRKQPKHSLYRSARIQKEYKKEGGTYEDDNLPKMNIKKWFKQDWISLNDYLRDKIVKCGNVDTQKLYGEYPLCRPLKIAENLTKPQIREMIEQKNILKEKPLKTSDIIGNKTLNIKPTETGMGKEIKKELTKKEIMEAFLKKFK